MIVQENMFLFKDSEIVGKLIKNITKLFFAVLITGLILTPIVMYFELNSRIMWNTFTVFVFVIFLLFIYSQFNLKILNSIEIKQLFSKHGKCLREYCDLSMGSCISYDNFGIWVCPNYEFDGKEKILEIITKILDNKIG